VLTSGRCPNTILHIFYFTIIIFTIVFLDAPHVFEREANATPDSPLLRNWYRANDERTIYTGWEDSVRHIYNFCYEQEEAEDQQQNADASSDAQQQQQQQKAHKPITCILGFSQGALMTAIFCMVNELLLKREQADPSSSCTFDAAENEFLKSVQDLKPLKHLKAVILVGGFVPVALQIKPVFEKFSTNGGIKSVKSLHIWGKLDEIIAPSMSKALKEAFNNATSVIVEHESGHVVPTKTEVVKSIKQVLDKWQ